MNDGFHVLVFAAAAAVAVIVILWLAHFIMGIRRTQKAYQEIIKSEADGTEKDPLPSPEASDPDYKITEEEGTKKND